MRNPSFKRTLRTAHFAPPAVHLQLRSGADGPVGWKEFLGEPFHEQIDMAKAWRRRVENSRAILLTELQWVIKCKRKTKQNMPGQRSETVMLTDDIRKSCRQSLGVRHTSKSWGISFSSTPDVLKICKIDCHSSHSISTRTTEGRVVAWMEHT